MVKQIDVDECRFSSVDLEIVTVQRRVAEIAPRFDLEIARWEEDGLGPPQGMYRWLRKCGKPLVFQKMT